MSKKWGKKVLVLWLMLLSCCAWSQQADYSYTNKLDKDRLLAGGTLRVKDPLLGSGAVGPAAGYYTRVSLVYGRENLTDLSATAGWNCKVKFKISFSGNATATAKSPQEVFELNLSVGKDGLNPVYMSSLVFEENYGNVALQITEVSSGTFPSDVRLELSLTGVQSTVLSQESSPELFYDALTQKVNWSYVPQAAQYELEWVYIDAYDVTATGNPLTFANSEEPFLLKEPVRIVSSELGFSPNLTLPEGKVYFRVRAVGKYPDANTQTAMYTPWSYGNNAQSVVSYTVSPFQQNLTWQAVTTFAEEGKYKKVLSYYDGSLRNRQTATNISSDNTTLVAETKYDYEGRGVVQLLPVPQKGSNLGYIENLNPFSEENTKGKAAYDNGGKPGPLAQNNVKGAAGYFSSLFLNDHPETLHKNYLPDAEQYPYTQTEYMPDNTGRIKRQSGVGEPYKLQETGDRNTRYFYSHPSDLELRRLFGATVVDALAKKYLSQGIGDALHYTKEMIVDPNGQASISYKDQYDKVVATCLAGDVPGNLNALTNRATQYVTIPLTNDNTLQVEAGLSRSVSQFLQTFAAGQDFTFSYDLTAHINKAAGICSACEYELTISITAPDGKPAKDENGNAIVIANNVPISPTVPFTCDVNGAGSYTSSLGHIVRKVKLTQIGTYTVIKELKLTKGAIETVKEQLKTKTDLVQIVDAKVPNYTELEAAYTAKAKVKSELMCNVTCEQQAVPALAALGNTNPTAQQIQDWVKINCPNPDMSDASDDECASLLEQMKQQLAPPGIPGDEVFWYNPQFLTQEKLNQLTRAQWEAALQWKQGDPAIVIPTQSDIFNPSLFKKQWLNALVILHPEYCHYEFCRMEKNTKDFDKRRLLISNWSAIPVSDPLLYDPVTNGGDPFLTDFPGNSRSGDIATFNLSARGSTDSKVKNYFNGDLNGDGVSEQLTLQQFVFSKIYSETDPVPTKEDPKTWRTFNGLYLQIKTRQFTKLKEVVFGCPYLRTGQGVSADVAENAVVKYPLLEGITNQDDPAAALNAAKVAIDAGIAANCSNENIKEAVDNWMGVIKAACSEYDLLSPTIQYNIRNVLTNYALSQCYKLNGVFGLFKDEYYTGRLDYIDDALRSVHKGDGSPCSISPMLTTRAQCIGKKKLRPEFNWKIDYWNSLIKMNREAHGSATSNGLGNGVLNPLNPRAVSQIDPRLFGISAECSDPLPNIVEFGFDPQDGFYIRYHTRTRDYNEYFLYPVRQGFNGSGGDVSNQIDKIESFVLDANNKIQYQIKMLDGTFQSGSYPSQVISPSFTSNYTYGCTSTSQSGYSNINDLFESQLEYECQSPGTPVCTNYRKLTVEPLPGKVTSERTWRIYNPNPVEVHVKWELLNGAGSSTSTTVLTTDHAVAKANSYVYVTTNSTSTSQFLAVYLSNGTSGQEVVTFHNEAAAANFTEPIQIVSVPTVNASSERLYRFYNASSSDIQIPWVISDQNGTTFGDQNGTHLAKAGKETYLALKPDMAFHYLQVFLRDNSITIPQGTPARNVLTIPEKTTAPVYSEDVQNQYCDNLNDFDPALQKQACLDELLTQAKEEAKQEYNKQLDYYTSLYLRDRYNNCLANSKETFTAYYDPGEYHYTLYYYDQAGNLVQTVPPAGVDIQPVDAATGQVITEPAHGLKTTYTYNSLGQLTSQTTPDAGTTYFWYNSAGQLRLSQNARQAVGIIESNVTYYRYSYTNYDEFGRATEVGQITNIPYNAAWMSAQANSKRVQDWLNDPTFPNHVNINNKYLMLKEVTTTAYSKPIRAPYGFVQENLRNRVAATYRIEDFSSNNRQSTFYSYDQHGNVKELVQKINCSNNLEDCEQSKHVTYQYDLISGKVNQVNYQPGLADRFSHRYSYDADNRLISVKTSKDGYVWEEDARYFYYKHGPLARSELGEDKVQGLDYFYTLQGWLKGVNTPDARSTDAVKRIYTDPGQDGIKASIAIPAPNALHQYIAQDEFALSLGYNVKDYVPTGGASLPLGYAGSSNWDAGSLGGSIKGPSPGKGLYNGNIASTVYQVHGLANSTNPTDENKTTLANAYQYDQLNRLISGNAYSRGTSGWTRTGTGPNTSAYDVSYSYDPNGNIETAIANGENGSIMHSLQYKYHSRPHPRGTAMLVNNKLFQVANIPAGHPDLPKQTNFTSDDASFETANNYQYDAIGNLVNDKADGVGLIEWNIDGKIKTVTRNSAGKYDLEFHYDAMGNRVLKVEKLRMSATTLSDPSTWISTYYLRDASGNVMQTQTMVNNKVTKTEYPVYGSSRLGRAVNASAQNVKLAETAYNGPKYNSANDQHILANKLVTSYLVGNDHVLFIPAGMILTSPVDVNIGGTVVIEGTLSSTYGVGVGKNGNIIIAPTGSLITNTISMQRGGTLRNYGTIQLTGNLSMEAPCVVQNFGTITSLLSAEEGGMLNKNGAWLLSGASGQSASLETDGTVNYSTVSTSVSTVAFDRQPGAKEYELNDHLGNVMSVVSGLKLGVGSNGKAAYYTANVLSANLYSPFGSTLPGRTLSSATYRYGFNGEEKDQNGMGGGGTTYDYGFRIYNPALGKFLSVDPLADKFPFYSPYQFAGLNPIKFVDLDGAEPYDRKFPNVQASDRTDNQGHAPGGQNLNPPMVGPMNAGRQEFIGPSNESDYSKNLSRYITDAMRSGDNPPLIPGTSVAIPILSTVYETDADTRINFATGNYTGAAISYGLGVLQISGEVAPITGGLRMIMARPAIGLISSEVAAATTGWKVGQPITNLTAKGNVPSWSTVRQRFWKNEAFQGGANYSESNLLRMQKGLAPQRLNPNSGLMESMELHHHIVPQRQGGLYDFLKVWPDEHRALDPFRR